METDMETRYRFAANLDMSGGQFSCWRWKGRLTEKGYGIFRVGGRKVRAHRWLVEQILGFDLEEDELVTHDCDVASCCNPRCLRVGDQESNMRERSERGRHWCTEKKECPQGHGYTPENTYVDPRGYRNCRTCARGRHRRRRATPPS